jgi:hypothetical protein
MDEAKTLSIMGLFDRKAGEDFDRLRRELGRRGVPVEDQEPHLTFGIYENITDREAFISWVAHAALFQKRLTLNFNHIGLFTQGICFAAPCADPLTPQHPTLHARYDQPTLVPRYLNPPFWATTQPPPPLFGKCNTKKKGGGKSWVPHTTLGVWQPERAGEYLPALLEAFRPFEATIEKLAVTEFPPMKLLREFPLPD